MAVTEARLRELVGADEGQYYDRKSLFEGPPGGKRPRDRRAVRDQIAEQIAGFANADGGVVIFGVEDDHSLTGHGYPADVVDQMLAVPQTRLVPPQAAGYRTVLDGAELLVFEVEAAPRAVRVGPQAVRALPISLTQKRALVGLVGRDFANADYCALNSVDRDTAYRELHELVDRDLLVMSGSGAGARYRVVQSSAVTARSASPLEVLEAKMREVGYITNADYREAFGVDRHAATAALSAWVAAGLLVREGERRTARYVPSARWPPR